MEIVSQKNLEILIDMGFEITYQTEDFIKLYNGKYDLEIDLFQSEERDFYSGVYMHIIRDNIVTKECKGRNIISNITRYIKRHCK